MLPEEPLEPEDPVDPEEPLEPEAPLEPDEPPKLILDLYLTTPFASITNIFVSETLEVAPPIIKFEVDIVPPITVNTEPSNVRLL